MNSEKWPVYTFLSDLLNNPSSSLVLQVFIGKVVGEIAG
jgi:hypothetical protein